MKPATSPSRCCRTAGAALFAFGLVTTAACQSAAPPAAPDGTLIVLNKSAASASLVDVATGAEAARLPTGAGPHEAAVSPDGRRVVVANYGQQQAGSSLTVIDVVDARVERTIDLGDYRRPHGVQFVDADRVAVTSEARRALLIVDMASGRVTSTFDTAQNVSHMVALAPDRTRAYVANIGSGSMTAIDLASGKVLAQVATGAGAEGIDVTPDGREVWVSNREADTVTVVDAARLQPVATLDAKGFPIRVRFTPDGRRALVTAPRADAVLVFDVAARRLERTIALRAQRVETDGRLLGGFASSSVPIGVVTGGAGRRAFVAQANADQVAVIDIDRGEVTGSLPTGKEPDGMAWSPLRVGRR